MSHTSTCRNGPFVGTTFLAQAWIDSWTFYRADGSESEPPTGEFTQNGVFAQNCATINFKLALTAAPPLALETADLRQAIERCPPLFFAVQIIVFLRDARLFALQLFQNGPGSFDRATETPWRTAWSYFGGR
jgi:hypothetical protein